MAFLGLPLVFRIIALALRGCAFVLEQVACLLELVTTPVQDSHGHLEMGKLVSTMLGLR